MDPEKIALRLQELGNAYAEAEYAASLLEESRRSIKAQVASEKYKELNMTASRAETEAEASSIYKEHIESMCKARRDANIAKINLEACRTWIELLRTSAANERAAMNLR